MKWKPSKVEGKQEAQRGGSANSCADYTHISAKYTHTHRHTHKSQCNECVKGWLRKGEGEAETESAHQCDSVHETRCQRLGQGCLQYIQRGRIWGGHNHKVFGEKQFKKCTRKPANAFS